MQSLQVIKSEYTTENIEKMFHKYARGRGKAKNKENLPEIQRAVFYCPLWIMTVKAEFKRLFLGKYRLVTGVAVDGWTRQAGSIGAMPGCDETSLPDDNILAAGCSREEAEEQALLFLQDALTLKHRSVPELEIRNVHLVYQPIFLGKYLNKQGKSLYILVDGVSGRQIFRYENVMDKIAAMVPAVKEVLTDI